MKSGHHRSSSSTSTGIWRNIFNRSPGHSSAQEHRYSSRSPTPNTSRPSTPNVAMAPTIHCVRHAQGFHNLSVANHQMHDPLLTKLGEEQCKRLQRDFPDMSKVDLVVASPLKRTIYTALIGFEPAIREKGLKVIAMPELQETSDLPCDTGSTPEEIAKEFEGKPVDLSLVKEGWNNKRMKWAPTATAIEKRARDARTWLMARPEKEIVVVTHGQLSRVSPLDLWLTRTRRLSPLLHRRLGRQLQIPRHRLGKHRVPLVQLQHLATRRGAHLRDLRIQALALRRLQASGPQRDDPAQANNHSRAGEGEQRVSGEAVTVECPGCTGEGIALCVPCLGRYGLY